MDMTVKTPFSFSYFSPTTNSNSTGGYIFSPSGTFGLRAKRPKIPILRGRNGQAAKKKTTAL
jgi:hypothetical protein